MKISNFCFKELSIDVYLPESVFCCQRHEVLPHDSLKYYLFLIIGNFDILPNLKQLVKDRRPLPSLIPLLKSNFWLRNSFLPCIIRGHSRMFCKEKSIFPLDKQYLLSSFITNVFSEIRILRIFAKLKISIFCIKGFKIRPTRKIDFGCQEIWRSVS